MLEKYIITQDKSAFVMKYNPDTELLIIGGFAQVRRLIEKFIEEVFQLEIPENTHSLRGRCMFKFPDVDRESFRQAQDFIDEDEGFIMEQVKNHGRLM